MITTDKTELKYVSVVVGFCKFCGEDFLGLLPTRIENLSKKYNLDIPKSNFLKSERQKNVCQLMKQYYKSLFDHILQKHELIQKEERKNRKLLETRGEVDEARLAALAAESSSREKLLQQATMMAEYLQESLPELPQSKEEEMQGGIIFKEDGTVSSSFFGTLEVGDIWEDEETKDFYTSLPDLKTILPSILYAESEKCVVPKRAESPEVPDIEEELETVENENSPPEEPIEEEDFEEVPDEEEEELIDEEEKEPTTLAKCNQKLAFNTFVQSLNNCVSRELVDSAAIEFCMNFNTKPYRKCLARDLFLVNRTRLDLLPFFARMVASLQPLMPDLPQDLIVRLRKDFGYQIKKKHQMYIESKLKVCRFIGELTKFNVFPGSDCLNCFKMLLNDFTHHQIEMACCILETAGRFLYRSPSTHHKTRVLLDQMMRKKACIFL